MLFALPLHVAAHSSKLTPFLLQPRSSEPCHEGGCSGPKDRNSRPYASAQSTGSVSKAWQGPNTLRLPSQCRAPEGVPLSSKAEGAGFFVVRRALSGEPGCSAPRAPRPQAGSSATRLLHASSSSERGGEGFSAAGGTVGNKKQACAAQGEEED